METEGNKFGEKTNDFMQKMDDYHERHTRGGRFMGGLILLGVGVVLLLNQLHTVIFPTWLFTWPMLLIVLGLYFGARHSFHGGGWLVMLLVGGAFMAENIYPSLDISDYIWPGIIIFIGLMMILRPKKNRWHWGDKYYWKNQKYQWKAYYKYGQQPPAESSYTQDDFIDSVSVFGSVQKVVVSKTFKGGDIVTIFGGSEINLTQADIQGRVIIEVVQIFGGTKIIVPADWEVKSQVVSIFGGVDDKRAVSTAKHNPEKVLVIDGTCIFGGIDILSY